MEFLQENWLLVNEYENINLAIQTTLTQGAPVQYIYNFLSFIQLCFLLLKFLYVVHTTYFEAIPAIPFYCSSSGVKLPNYLLTREGAGGGRDEGGGRDDVEGAGRHEGGGRHEWELNFWSAIVMKANNRG